MGVLTLERVRAGASPALYPRHLLVGSESALVLFAAAFHGQQDAVWMAEAGLAATCVDHDHEKLGQMVLAYPEGWEYVYGDVFEYAVRTSKRWDVVSIDCPSNLFDRCAELMPLWCRIARKAVVVGSGRQFMFHQPEGWRFSDSVFRSHNYGDVYWRVFQPC
jgi:hypothetical protein